MLSDNYHNLLECPSLYKTSFFVKLHEVQNVFYS